MAESKLSMKLLIDVRGKRVLFAEAGKDCVDFLFYILSLPVSTLINLLGKEGMVGSMSNLYESIQKMDASYIQPNISKSTLLHPLPLVSGYSVPLLSLKEAKTSAKKFYRPTCGCCGYYSDDTRATCPSHGHSCYKMTTEMSYVAPPPDVKEASSVGGGFVKGVVTYMVMDVLVVKPMSTISSITMLNKFNIKDVGALQEKVVDFGMNEAVKLVKASLETKKVLTNVFLNGTM